MDIFKPELLSPAGSYEALKAAVNAGCNAVYLGGEKFGARANAANFSNDILPEAIDFAHLNNVKAYFTANTLIKQSEISDFLKQVSFLYSEGIDGLIIQDIGVIKLLTKYFPELPLHGSTQMTVHNINGIKFLEELGFERVVLSRELSLGEIQDIIKESNIEIECFIHGALCYSYSGQCLFSSLIGGRSGNRGTCAQPCRLPYDLLDSNEKSIKTEGKYLISPKDIQTLELIPELIKSKIHSFKIEGRMKNANYVGLVTYLYRKYIDLYLNSPNDYKVDKSDIIKLTQIYNRGGFSKGYFNTRNGIDMMSLHRPNHQGIKIGNVEKIIDPRCAQIKLDMDVNQGDCLEINSLPEPISFIAKEKMHKQHKLIINTRGIRQNSPIFKLTDVNLINEIENRILKNEPVLKVKLTFNAHIGNPCELILEYNNLLVKTYGETVELAQTSATSYDKIYKQLTKTGNDPVIFEPIQLHLDDNIFISIKGINELRREGIRQLIQTITGRTKRESIEVEYNNERFVKPLNNPIEISVLIRNREQFEALKGYEIDDYYFELNGFLLEELGLLISECNSSNIEPYIALPRIIRKPNEKWILQALDYLKEYRIKGMLVRTIDAYELVKNYKNIIIDYTINTFNNEAIRCWESKFINKIAISPELNYNELSKLYTNKLEIVLYGYLPLMISAQCIHTLSKEGCNSPISSTVLLKDRKNIIFKSIKDCKSCTHTIYNSLPIVLIDKYKELKSIGITKYRLEFLDEASTAIKDIMDYTFKIKSGEPLSSNDLEKIIPLSHYTRGHYNRGVK